MVTADELKDLAYLPGEITSIDRAIESLQSPPYLKAMDTRQKAECAAALTELIQTYRERRQMCARQLDRLRAFLDGIEDDFTRDLFGCGMRTGKSGCRYGTE